MSVPDVNKGPPSLWERIAADIPHRQRLVVASERLATNGKPVDTVTFPLNAVCVMARHYAYDPDPLVSGMAGREGMLGWSRFLGNQTWRSDIFVVVGGDVVDVPADALVAVAEADPDLRALILRYIHNYTMQQAQNTIANLGHSLERRLARWLTMIHDRVAGDAMQLTHETLAMLLNVRRASVTDALHILEGERLVRCTRGLVTVRDRPGLQAAAGYSYGYAETDYAEAIGPFGKGLDGGEQTEREPTGDDTGG